MGLITRLRPAALVAGHADFGGRRRLSDLPVFQRHHVLHARLRRSGAHRRGRPGAERGRGRHRLRLPGRHRQLPAGALSGVFAARDHHLAARRPGRLAAERRRTAAAAGGGTQPGRRGALPGRVGALGGRAAGKPPLVSRAELLPLAAREPVVGRRADGHPRHIGAADRWRGRAGRLPGPADLRHGAARGGGPGAGVSNAAAAAAARSPAGGGTRPAVASRFARRA